MVLDSFSSQGKRGEVDFVFQQMAPVTRRRAQFPAVFQSIQSVRFHSDLWALRFDRLDEDP